MAVSKHKQQINMLCWFQIEIDQKKTHHQPLPFFSINVWRINLDNHDIKRLTVKSWYYCHWLHCIQVLSLLYPFWLGKQYGSFLLFYVLSSKHYVLATKNIQVQSTPVCATDVYLFLSWVFPYLCFFTYYVLTVILQICIFRRLEGFNLTSAKHQ